MLADYLMRVREDAPLIHNITNHVTINDVANVLHACGASPIMAEEADEVEEITSLARGLCLNIGTLHRGTVPAMLRAGRQANKLAHPVVLDPVGAGASRLRTETALELLREVRFAAVRGNMSEMKTLYRGSGTTRGVDADAADAVQADDLDAAVRFAQAFARKTGAVAAMTGAIDIVADADRAAAIFNGCPELRRITGAGCMLSALTTAFVAASPEHPFEATVAAVCAFGLCGERAAARLTEREGNATFRTYLIDEIYCLDEKTLEEGANYEMR